MTVTIARVDRLRHHARLRQERRWKAMLARSDFRYGRPHVTLYVEALRLEEALTALSIREMTEPELDALHESTMADLDDLAAGFEPPLALMTETEARYAFGDR